MAHGTAAAIILNANPFTYGHLYLVEQAAAENDLLHLFVVSEDVSFFPYDIRDRLVREGTAHLKNIVHHATGPYMISQATFPSYFQKDEDAAIRSHAQLDIAVFSRIAQALSITRRYVGEEQVSRVTRLYNEIMLHDLPLAGIECRVIPRKEREGAPISASTVRRAIQSGSMDALPALVPPTTLAFLQSEESAAIRKKNCRSGRCRTLLKGAIMLSGIPVELSAMLAAREERARQQDAWLKQYQCPLLSFTLNIPGPVKDLPGASSCF